MSLVLRKLVRIGTSAGRCPGADLATLRFTIDRSWCEGIVTSVLRDMLNSRMNGQSALNPLGLPSDWVLHIPFAKGSTLVVQAVGSIFGRCGN